MRRVLLVTLLFAACRPPGYGRHAPGGDVDAAPAPADAAVDSPAGCDHGFRLDGHITATSVWLSGDFVMWAASVAAGAIPFTQGPEGGWTVSRQFAPGTYQYKFIVDGSQWILDPTNPATADDGHGNTNSVFTCGP